MWRPTCTVDDTVAVSNFSEDKVPSSLFVALSFAIARLTHERRRPSVCPSVRPSVTNRYRVNTNAHVITWFSPADSPGTLV